MEAREIIGQRSDVQWDDYNACEYAEGFGDGEGADESLQTEAWAYLIHTGLVWKLQGWYGRTANHFIEIGLISKEGKINWEMFDAAVEQAKSNK